MNPHQEEGSGLHVSMTGFLTAAAEPVCSWGKKRRLNIGTILFRSHFSLSLSPLWHLPPPARKRSNSYKGPFISPNIAGINEPHCQAGKPAYFLTPPPPVWLVSHAFNSALQLLICCVMLPASCAAAFRGKSGEGCASKQTRACFPEVGVAAAPSVGGVGGGGCWEDLCHPSMINVFR